METVNTEREVRAPAQLWRGRDPKRRDLEPVSVGTDGCEDNHRPRRRRGEAAERVEPLASDHARDARAQVQIKHSVRLGRPPQRETDGERDGVKAFDYRGPV